MNTPVELEQAINLLRDAYAAFNRGDIAAAVARLDPDIEWREPPEFPGGGIYHGRAGASEYLTQSRAAWLDVHSEPERFIPVGDLIVVFVHARVRAHGSDEPHVVTELTPRHSYSTGTRIKVNTVALASPDHDGG